MDSNEVYEEIQKLPEDMKTVIILRFYEELSLQEISEVTKTNLSTVKSRLYAALKNCRKVWRRSIMRKPEDGKKYMII